MEVIAFDDGDDASAYAAATDLLQNALRLRASVEPSGAPLGAPLLTYSARWMGSPLTVGAFGVHSTHEVGAGDLAEVMQGRNVINGHQLYSAAQSGLPAQEPGGPAQHLSFVLEIPVAEELAREHLNATPERKAEIEDAAITSVELAVEYARRSVRMVPTLFRGVFMKTHATGIPALGIVRTPDEGGGLRVEVVIPAVERPDGSIGTPGGEQVIALERMAAGPGMERVVRQGLAAARSHEPQTRPVGRGQAWVTDPLDGWRPYVSENLIAQLDARATLYGEQLVERTDEQLETELARIDRLFEPPDPERGAQGLRLERELRRASEAYSHSSEERFLSAVRLDSRGLSPEGQKNADHAHDVIAVHHRDTSDEYMDALMEVGDSSYQLSWMAANGARAVEWLAYTRELAIRGRERELHLEPDRALVPPPAHGRHIGVGDVAWVHADREATRIGRDDVTAPKSLRKLHDVAPEWDLATVKTLARRYEEEIVHESDEWVSARHAALGPPEEGLDRGGARELKWIEMRQTKLEARLEELRDKIQQAGGRMRSDGRELGQADGLSPGEVLEYNTHTRQLQQLEEQMGRLIAEERHPEAWTSDRERVVLATVYADEAAIREELGRRREVERSVVAPGEHVIALVGPRGKGAEWEQIEPEWEAVVREIEYQRLSAEAAAERPDAREPPDPQAQAQLDERIDRLREARDLESPSVAAIEAPGLES